MEYQYPLDLDWTNEEMVDVIAFFNTIENYYEKSVKGSQVMTKYKRFKEIVPGKAEEKQLFKEFENTSGYNSYKVVQEVKKNPERETFSMN
ncbi:UPF0223 family protein [Staphylococcus devriesei]|uniref:UPF0223 protein BUY44_00860 n=1 Tax=Staphylococcus devriesei TaxID=586733 RepID=A0A2K4DLD0_9STAP|nr:UPF0223 family protein [Staphylococcus devriesei]MCE5089395.1 UPF0223 family protein [Staphylococcus devriesei]MCE5096355.1 UPF0223 family protein [Staphylococcus devriesei]PNZ87597.1 hypothetical protein CD147_07130 [Staphylococcus devriesei]PTE74539.1 hypothetical protein BUY44_00860 [Staphylococcus devriesei]PTF03314.1 hypothetical protein BUY45_08990 [Staphylococcus devriesei]